MRKPNVVLVVVTALLVTMVCARNFISAQHQRQAALRERILLDVTWQEHEARLETSIDISGYRNWKKVNPTPQRLFSRLDMLCVGPTPAQVAAEEKRMPHVGAYMQCYVNSIGQNEMMTSTHPNFREGSIIVKDKLVDVNPLSDTVLVTAMIKRTKGYDPKHGDWEYIVWGPGAKTVQARGKLANCGGCHEQKRNSDFVFRDEIPAEVRRQMK